MEEIHVKREVRSDLMTVADMCDPVEEKQIMESMLGIDDVGGELLDPSLRRKARQEETRGFEERQVYHHVLRSVAQSRSRRQVHRSALGACEQGFERGAESK